MMFGTYGHDKCMPAAQLSCNDNSTSRKYNRSTGLVLVLKVGLGLGLGITTSTAVSYTHLTLPTKA